MPSAGACHRRTEPCVAGILQADHSDKLSRDFHRLFDDLVSQAEDDGGIAGPSAFAVGRFTTNSNLVDGSIRRFGWPGAIENLVEIDRRSAGALDEVGSYLKRTPTRAKPSCPKASRYFRAFSTVNMPYDRAPMRPPAQVGGCYRAVAFTI